MKEKSRTFKNATYEFFIAILSILVLINLLIYYLFPLETTTVVLFMNGLLSFVFLGDFIYRLFSAPSKPGYFFKDWGWADLISCLPFPEAKIFRIFRLYQVARTARSEGSRIISRNLRRNVPQSAFISLSLLIILLLEFGSMAILYFEFKSPGANILSADDAIWYTFVTITTVGYGDQYPVSLQGRLIGMLIMTAGVGLFGTLTGYLSNIFLVPRSDENGAKKGQETDGSTVENPLESKLNELKSLLVQQQAIQLELESKISSLEEDILQNQKTSRPPAGATSA